ncbi:Serine/threonine-protein kinase prk-2 [Liparis tanakae]|uniref:non-specific serine/threonine protein kinase n=1 Tax=Liparis tanakae TaxID=230148 RepID=A0A4Z2HTK1_9TELE|nr:Serine/threonine-protein kinase prk-2 [Liparis tanakae]
MDELYLLLCSPAEDKMQSRATVLCGSVKALGRSIWDSLRAGGLILGDCPDAVGSNMGTKVYRICLGRCIKHLGSRTKGGLWLLGVVDLFFRWRSWTIQEKSSLLHKPLKASVEPHQPNQGEGEIPPPVAEDWMPAILCAPLTHPSGSSSSADVLHKEAHRNISITQPSGVNAMRWLRATESRNTPEAALSKRSAKRKAVADDRPVQKKRILDESAIFKAKYQQQQQLGQGGYGCVAIKRINTDNNLHLYKDGDGNQIPMEVIILRKLAAESEQRSAPIDLLDWYVVAQELILVLERPMPAILIKQLVDAAIDLGQKHIFHRDIKKEVERRGISRADRRHSQGGGAIEAGGEALTGPRGRREEAGARRMNVAYCSKTDHPTKHEYQS